MSQVKSVMIEIFASIAIIQVPGEKKARVANGK